MGWWILIVVVVILYLLQLEYRSQNALGRTCYNSTPPVVATDDPTAMVMKSIETIRRNHTLVVWRLAMIIALLVMLAVLALWCPGMAFIDYLVGALIVFVVVYAGLEYSQQGIYRFDEALEARIREQFTAR